MALRDNILGQVVRFHRDRGLASPLNFHLLLLRIDRNFVIIGREGHVSLHTTGLYHVCLHTLNQFDLVVSFSKGVASHFVFLFRDFERFQVAHVAFSIVRQSK